MQDYTRFDDYVNALIALRSRDRRERLEAVRFLTYAQFPERLTLTRATRKVLGSRVFWRATGLRGSGIFEGGSIHYSQQEARILVIMRGSIFRHKGTGAAGVAADIVADGVANPAPAVVVGTRLWILGRLQGSNLHHRRSSGTGGGIGSERLPITLDLEPTGPFRLGRPHQARGVRRAVPLLGAELPPYAIAAALVDPMAISHWSALAHHGLSTQIPPMIQASTPRTVVTPEMRAGQAHRPRGRAVWRALGLEFEFIRIKPKHFFGFQQEWVSSWHRVSITDPERTILDMVAHPRLFGTLGTAIETLEANLEQLNLEKLVGYALRYDVGAVIKRLGWVLETLGAPAVVVEPLRAYPVRAYYPLDPTGPPGGAPVARWRVRDNLRRGSTDGNR